MDAWLWLLVLGTVFVGSTIQAALGIGLGLLAAPILALFAPHLVPGPLLASVLGLTLIVLWRDRRSVQLHGLGWALVGRLPGTLLGAWIVARLERASLDVALGSLLLACVLASAFGERLRGRAADASGHPPAWLLGLAGAFSGVSGTAAGVGGPPVALVFRRYAPDALRATMSGFFLFGVSLSLTSLTAMGEFGRAELLSAAALLPAVALGVLAAVPAKRRLRRDRAQHAVLGLSAAGAVALVLRGLGLLG